MGGTLGAVGAGGLAAAGRALFATGLGELHVQLDEQIKRKVDMLRSQKDGAGEAYIYGRIGRAKYKALEEIVQRGSEEMALLRDDPSDEARDRMIMITREIEEKSDEMIAWVEACPGWYRVIVMEAA